MSANYVATTNACKMCTPMGASLAFLGIEGGVPYHHGSQGCSTYMRRYIISHYREPVDIASSSLGEKHAVYGGGPNFKKGLLNVMRKYEPKVIGIASTCLTETIGDDLHMLTAEFKEEFGDLDLPELVYVSTPSYAGSHMEGFHGAVRAVCAQIASDDGPHGGVNLLGGFVSCEDIRWYNRILADFGIKGVVLPDYSMTLDGPSLTDYQRIPVGGTPLAGIKSMGNAAATIELGRAIPEKLSGALALQDRFDVPAVRLGLPIGLRETDRFIEELERVSGREAPEHERDARGRLVDAYVDGHKYLYGKRAVVYGEEDLVIGVCAFLAEIGVQPVLAASGQSTGKLEAAIREVTDGLVREDVQTASNVDFYEIAELAESLKPDLLVGHSKGYRYAKEWDVPLIRVGFPIHDRFGGQRINHVGYHGAQALFDRIVNAVIEYKQSHNSVGYGYI